MNGEAFTVLNPRSFVGNFFGLWLLKHSKFRIAYSDVQTFLEGEENRKLRIQWLW